jgi:hypothetical protein
MDYNIHPIKNPQIQYFGSLQHLQTIKKVSKKILQNGTTCGKNLQTTSLKYGRKD